MRITQQFILDSAAFRLRQNQEVMNDLRVQIATGRSILKPEDDPQGTQQAINQRRYLAGVQNADRNVQYSLDWMNATDLGMAHLEKIAVQAREDAQRAANETLSMDERRSVGDSVRELFKQAADVANTEHRGQYIFAGYKVNTQPFVTDLGDLTFTYQGDSGAIHHDLEPGTRMVVNVPGSDPLFSDTLTAVKALYDAIQANDTSGIRAAMGNVDTALEGILQRRGEVGSRVRGVQFASDRLQKLEVELTSLLSQTENADAAKTIMDLSSAEQGYQATLSAISRFLPSNSLFDYLR